MEEVIVSGQKLKELCVKKFKLLGLSGEDAEIAADILVHANLRGVDSHGISRMEYYTTIIRNGSVNPAPRIRINETGPVTAFLDGDRGLGLVLAHRAMQEAIRLAKKSGVGMVGVYNSSHCGALSYYVRMAAQEKLIGMATTHADSGVVAFGGRKPFFGTNPLAFGFPAGRNPHIILDMATSTVAYGKIIHDYLHRNKPIPADWAVDEDGNSVTDPRLVKWMKPFGGAKGFGLGLVADVLSGILSGGSFGPHITMYDGTNDGKSRIGQFVCAVNPSFFTDTDRFLDTIDQMIDELHEVPPAEGFQQVMVPGEPETLREEQRSKTGIPVPENIYRYLCD